MIGAHIQGMVGLALSRSQRLLTFFVLVGSGLLFSMSSSQGTGALGFKAVLLLLVAVMLLQWRTTLISPEGARLELPIPLRPGRAEWITSGLQAAGAGGVGLCLSAGWVLAGGHDLAEVWTALVEHILVDSLVSTLLLVPILTLLGRRINGGGTQREVFIWAAGPALGALSVVCMALELPRPVVYALWLGMFVALIVTAVLLVGRLLGRLGRRRTQSSVSAFRSGQRADKRLASDGWAGIKRAILWMVVCDGVGWCLFLFAFSSWMFHGLGLDAEQAQNFVVPLGMALVFGVRVLALSSLLGQVGFGAGVTSWRALPWGLLPLPRTTIQRALLRHIGIVSLVAIGLNIAFLSTWGMATEMRLWTTQHEQLSGLISYVVQSVAVSTAVMAMWFMTLGTGLRSRLLSVALLAGTTVCGILFVFNVPVPGAAAAYVPSAVLNLIAVIGAMAVIWAVSWRCADSSE